MCRAKRYTEQLLEIYDKINQDLEYFKYKLQYLQRQFVQGILHTQVVQHVEVLWNIR